MIDMGPQAGEAGGEIVFQGSLPELLASRTSLTAAYLTGRRSVSLPAGRTGTPRADETRPGSIGIRGAAEHNLKSIDVDLPLHTLVCLTGVSGSGKSTLMEEVLYNGIRAMTGRPVDTPGRCTTILGISQIDDVVLVDQSSIGKTTRSNPASYVGAFEAIRALFAAEPEAVERGYTAGTFSFNSGNGRCPTCGGNGFEHVEMQFLSDVYVRCSECNGTRYRSQILDIRLSEDRPGFPAAVSIADVLEMTVDRACEYFADFPKVLRGLEPLRAVGLGYLRLGQPVPTLSGGEAQRLKLAGYLAETAGKKNAGRSLLFLFDEPTTGLHFEDIAVLLIAFRRLLEAGHSVVVIEHNLDVIAASDWIIDLGPEGGDRGGRVVAAGPPQTIVAGEGHTARALREYAAGGASAAAETLLAAEAPPAYRATAGISPAVVSHDVIEIRHAREHNLKNIDLKIPLGSFSLITGVSGSGKSTIAFDILFAEGQRRYLESLNAYARQFVQPAARPDVDAVLAVPPTVAIEQRTTRGGYKSTVATVTEVYHFLRLLFVKLGVQYCPQCEVAIQPQTPDAVVSQILTDYRGRTVQLLAPLVVSRKGYYTDLARWAAAKGYEHLRVDGELLPTDSWPRLDRFREHTIELPVAEMKITARVERDVAAAAGKALGFGKGVLHLVAGGSTVVFSTRRACPSCGTGFAEPDPRLFSYNSRHGWCPTCTGTGLAVPPDAGEEERGDISVVDRLAAPCPECAGTRLNAQARAVRFGNRSITDVAALSVDDSAELVAAMELQGREEAIGRDIVAELRSRLSFLQQVGLGYLPLDRAAPTLSGGEAQRIRLASQLGSNLRGVCYVLDEPTIGLHARDNAMLLDTLTGLQRKGNTVVVVEHDEASIRRAEHVIDLGPGGGVTGGEVLFAGTAAAFLKDRRSITAAFLRNPPRHPLVPRPPRVEDRGTIIIQGADLHNLNDVDAEIPLGRFVCVTGVSGSGKSSLIRDVLHRNLAALLAPGVRRKKSAPALIGCRGIDGHRLVSAIREVDQTPIGKTPRSTPATYVGIWDAIRKLFAGLPESRMRGYTASRFSFNTTGGRCESCGGQGLQRIEMSFLPNVTVICESCAGKRFTPDTLEVEFKGRSISDVLEMSIEQAVEFFAAQPSIHRPLQLLCDVGLGYLRLGQQSPTLSGGEAQRIKLVTELAKARTAGEAPRRGAASGAATPGGALYILDEPTIGLHMADVQRLAEVIHRLVDAGNSVIVIEHNLDLIAEADWIIDLGPEGGAGGGNVVVSGPPDRVAAEPRSHTGRFLAEVLAHTAPGDAAPRPLPDTVP
ncbi:MAG: excinuclease ABC subunit UvrA [Spirochaetaceae bacterium]|nr:MAG: excinuclease ABC subunit UvrA [Spirochaetaceae bacterium]